MSYLEIIPDSIRLIKLKDEEYFSKAFNIYISNSKLSLLNPEEGGSVKKYLNGFSDSFNESFSLGAN